MILTICFNTFAALNNINIQIAINIFFIFLKVI